MRTVGSLAESAGGEALERGDRQPEPVRPIVRLVADLVTRLLELERAEQRTPVVADAPVGVEQRAARLGEPRLAVETGRVRPGGRRAGGVVEAAQHAGDVAKGRRRRGALVERARRLA